MQNKQLLLIEDDNALAQLVRWHFEREDFTVTQTPSGEEGLALALEIAPDVILLDWMLEELSGIEVCRRLRRNPHTANLPILMLTGRGEESDRIRGLETGADDYVTKPFSPAELVARVNAGLRRIRPGLSGATLHYADIDLDTANYKVRRGGHPVALAPTEFKILRHLMEHPGRAFSRARILDAIWGSNADVELRTIDVHIRRLRQALNANGGREVIRTIRAVGYSLDADTESD